MGGRGAEMDSERTMKANGSEIIRPPLFNQEGASAGRNNDGTFSVSVFYTVMVRKGHRRLFSFVFEYEER